MIWFNVIKKFFQKEGEKTIDNSTSNTQKEATPLMKYLIAGLGNIGAEYDHTRHNIGFDILNKMAEQEGLKWEVDNQAYVCEMKHKGRLLILIKPTTYMNLSGKAVNYHLNKHKLTKENLLVVLDDLHLDFGILRMRDKGSDGGHNGLKNIDLATGGSNYPRLKVGIGSKFHKGQQSNFVLGKWKKDEQADLDFIIDKAIDGIKAFAAIGYKMASNQCNGDVLKK